MRGARHKAQGSRLKAQKEKRERIKDRNDEAGRLGSF
jgi:hypothetical protein